MEDAWRICGRMNKQNTSRAMNDVCTQTHGFASPGSLDLRPGSEKGRRCYKSKTVLYTDSPDFLYVKLMYTAIQGLQVGK